jgi:hypothetical protein
MARYSSVAGLLAPLLGACSGGFLGCLPAEGTAERQAFRGQLAGVLHLSQCPDPPIPKSMTAEAGKMETAKRALLERIRRTPLRTDVERVIREGRDASRDMNESDCDMSWWDAPDAPGAIRDFRERLRGERAQLQALEADFRRLMAQCGTEEA